MTLGSYWLQAPRPRKYAHATVFYPPPFSMDRKPPARIARTCTHPPGSHSTIAGKKVGDRYLSELTAEYPSSLAHSLAQLFLPYVTSQGMQNASIADFADMIPETYVPRRLRVCDGAGMNSTADHTFPAQSKLQKLADSWWSAMDTDDLPQRLFAHMRQGNPSHPLSPDAQHQIACIAAKQFLPSSTVDQALHVSEGQPYRLKLLPALASQCNDPDSELIALLDEGVPTGIFSELLSSQQ